MKCKDCGSPIQNNHQYCSNCGRHIEQIERPKKSWKKWIFGTLGVLAVSVVLLYMWAASLSKDLVATVEGQLAALRNQKISEAYYAYTSRDFQANVPLKTYKDLINAFSVLTQNQGISITERLIDGSLVTLKGLLKHNNDVTPIQFELVHEDNTWKIQSMLLAAPATVDPSSRSTIEWLVPIDTQLRLLRGKEVMQAYNDTTSKEFKQATKPEDFTKFIEKNPIMTEHTTIMVKGQSLQKDEAQVSIILNPDKEAVTVQYLLVFEDGKWKIWNVSVEPTHNSAVQGLLKDEAALKLPIEGQLKALLNNEIPQAYSTTFLSRSFQRNTSLNDFRKWVITYPMISHYDRIEIKKPVVDKGTGVVEVDLYDKGAKMTLEYTLGIEDDQWKIWGIQVLAQPKPLKDER